MKINTQKVQQLRLMLNLSQPTVAEMMSMHQATYSRFESGETKFDLERTIKLSTILKCAPKDIILCDKVEIVLINESKLSNSASNIMNNLDLIENKIKELQGLINALKSDSNM